MPESPVFPKFEGACITCQCAARTYTDAPLVDEALLIQLYATAKLDPETPLMTRRGAQWEPLFCIIPVSLAPAIEHAWQKGERSNLKILLTLQARALDLDVDDSRLANLNSPELLLKQAPSAGT